MHCSMSIEQGTKKKRSRRGGGKQKAAAAEGAAGGASAAAPEKTLDSASSDDDAPSCRATHFLFFGQSAPFVLASRNASAGCEAKQVL